MPFGIGRAIKKGANKVGKEIGRAAERVGDEIDRASDRVTREVSRGYQKTGLDLGRRGLRKLTNQAQAFTENYFSATTALAGPQTGTAKAGADAYGDVQYDEAVAADERRAQRDAEREAKEKARLEAERGAELLRRRRMRRLGGMGTSGFGSASNDYKTVLGV